MKSYGKIDLRELLEKKGGYLPAMDLILLYELLASSWWVAFVPSFLHGLAGSYLAAKVKIKYWIAKFFLRWVMERYRQESIREWEVTEFQSGTMIVNRPRQAGVPHYYVYGPGLEQTARRMCCLDLRDYLNGGTRPAWLADMDKIGLYLMGPDGTSIRAVGPYIDKAPPNCLWIEDPSAASERARKGLIEDLFEGGG